ncbi:exodeoxyribonuclease VII small subunit [Pedobacter sp.]|nr:exodeoxyribonuclease VII small subunit [Candidatus Saccharibacteria bacterium]
MSQKETNLQTQLQELEAIVAWFEQDDIEIEAAIAKFEEGSQLADSIKEKLSGLENKITVLKQRFDDVA